jgi:hypothetical protein
MQKPSNLDFWLVKKATKLYACHVERYATAWTYNVKLIPQGIRSF